ncbi:sialate O-acetylesterase [Flavobacterium jejuense]|uniref:Sialate O-acetylesterase n=1 Tax=Flavobacterium jejuense TaxID=1544455 RepID=A0ABX0IT73_9FLAO|nr:sialate O-acetylesterase [Flavobacterium jejuense]NHN25020.1 sialate O-acetylesterase [Flavobacterium jejuense]
MKNKFTLYILLFFSNLLMANISLPSIFSNGMVLQRNSEVKIWGWANPKEEITIKPSWNNKEYKVTGTNQANWEISIPTPKEGGPYTIILKGYNEVVLSDILIGEVWLCSGQSNMEMSANWGIENGEEEIKNANYPLIRFFSVEKAAASSLQNNLMGSWQTCTPETMKYNSALAYFFGKRLQEDLKDVPIGLLVSAWGGTPAEVWIPEKVIETDRELLEEANKRSPSEYCPVKSGRTFNTMINPLVGYKIAGTLWYQGESNVGSTIYDKTFAALITSWRALWKDNFPFYFVQIAPYQYGENHFGGVEIRNFQRKTLVLPKTGMVLTSDISPIDDIHPKDKKTVGIRLANLALAEYYKTNNNLVNGPLFDTITTDKNKVVVHFKYNDGLYFKDKKGNQFEIAGADNVFYQAKAVIKNDKVVLTSNKVKKPLKVRFAWSNTAQAQLFNKANLPASSFITE